MRLMRCPVGIAVHAAGRLRTAQVNEAITALRALIEHREDLVRTRIDSAGVDDAG
jgi:hypothetical protein